MCDEPHLLRSFGRRRGRNPTPRQAHLLDSLLPELLLPEAAEPLSPHAIFPGMRELWMEIGFGGGEHLAAQAAAHPDIGFIGCEPFRDGVVKLLSAVEEHKLNNIRLWADDARPLMERMPDACLSRLYLLFPDPWPKARHHKRRIVNPRMLDAAARLLRPGGEWRIVTDHAEYAEWILLHLTRDNRFEWMANNADDFTQPPDDWVITRYQQKAQAEGRAPLFLFFRRR